jgi:hypothetical protein
MKGSDKESAASKDNDEIGSSFPQTTDIDLDAKASYRSVQNDLSILNLTPRRPEQET